MSVLQVYALQVRLYIFAFIKEADDLGSLQFVRRTVLVYWVKKIVKVMLCEGGGEDTGM